MEIWREIPIPGCQFYQASSDGRIRRSQRGRGAIVGKVLKPAKNRGGYLRIKVYSGGDDTRKWKFIHRLVAATFIGEPTENRLVNHKDSDRQNNVLENLEYVTAQENSRHRFKYDPKPDPDGAF